MDQLEQHIEQCCMQWTETARKRVRVAGALVPLLLFADDIVLASTDPKLSQLLLTCLSDWCTASGLTVNTDKTNTLVGGVVARAGHAGNQMFAHHNYELHYRGVAVPVVRL